MLKRDVVSTLATRVSIILEELLTSDADCKGTGKDKKGTHTCYLLCACETYSNDVVSDSLIRKFTYTQVMSFFKMTSVSLVVSSVQ